MPLVTRTGGARGTTRFRVRDSDITVGCAGQSPRQRQPEPGSVVTVMRERAVTRLEDALADVLGRDRRPVVRDVDELTGFDAVVHLAALSNDPLGDLDAELTYDINDHATVRLARLARTAGVSRFLFSSSCSNYGASRRLAARRGRGVQSGHAVRRVEGAGRGGTLGARERRLQSRHAPQRDGVRGVLTAFDATSCSTTSPRGQWPRAR